MKITISEKRYELMQAIDKLLCLMADKNKDSYEETIIQATNKTDESIHRLETESFILNQLKVVA